MIRLALASFALTAAGCSYAWGDCDHTAPRDLDLDAAGLESLVVNARAGELDIRGEAGLDRVIVSGRACAGSADYLEQIRLLERRDGSRLTVAVEIPDSSGWGGDYGWLDLKLRVPARLALEVSDSSGDTTIAGVAGAEVDDSSGDLRIADIAGDLSVEDSSGDIDIRTVAGHLTIPSDSSGDIRAEDITGNVAIADDSSGSIELRRVRGDATVDQDSSGDIRFVAIGGSARVGDDSSGSIEAEDVGRDFIVERDGSGGIEHSGVKGAVRIPEDD